MLKPYKIADYLNEYKPQWTCVMPDGCPPEDVLVAEEHPFFRLAKQVDSYSADDFMSYAEADPQRNWGQMLPLSVGLSLIESEAKARRSLKLPMFRQYQGISASHLTRQTALSNRRVFTVHTILGGEQPLSKCRT